MTAELRRAFGAAGAALIAALAAAFVLGRCGVVGALVALAVFAAVGVVVRFGIVDHRDLPFGIANRITLFRVVLTGVIIALLDGPRDETARWLILALGGVAVTLDGVDGWLARARGLSSPFGGRFDMEIDSLTVLALAVALPLEGAVGWWIVASGMLRYLFVLAGGLWPPLTGALPPRAWRRRCAFIQGGTLVAAMAPVFPPAASAAIAGAGLAVVLLSFAIDIAWLIAHRAEVTHPPLAVRLRRLLGVLRSLAIYHAIPGRAARLQRLYAPFVPRGALCIDIGAHVGSRVRCWRRLGARVVAVEPQPAFYAILRRLFGSDRDVVLVPEAIDAVAGVALLQISDATPTVSTLAPAFIAAAGTASAFAGVRWERSISVPTTTLDALIARYGEPAFVKIDVEGAEPQVLAGLSRALPALSFECVPAARALALACVDRLEQLGRYRYNWSPGESHRLVHGKWIDAAALRQWLAALPPDAPSGDIYARRAL